MGHAERANDKVTRRITFTDQKLWFALVYEAFVSRGSNRERKVSLEDKKSEARILRCLKAISEPIGPDVPDGQPDQRNRKLNEDGGSFDLGAQDFNRLLRYLRESQNPATLADVADDVEQFIANAPAAPAEETVN